jgi:hypothetical protein
MKEQVVTPQIVRRNTYLWAIYYLENKPKESVWRNRHMNAFGLGFENKLLGTENLAHDDKLKGRKPKITSNHVQILVMDDWTKLQGVTKISLLTLLSTSLKEKKELLYENAKAYEIGKDYVNAFIVDLINYIGVRMGVDYAMYTRDV